MRNPVLIILFFLLSFTATAQKQYSLYFDSNKYEIDPASDQMRIFKSWMAANKESKIVSINGFTDEDGTITSNDTLAQRRVTYVFGLINGNIKIRDDFETRSFGELHKHYDEKAKNRRVDIFYIRKDELHRENEILGIEEEPKPEPEKKPIVYTEKIVLRNPNGTTDEIVLDTVFMKKVGTAKPGEHLAMKNLNFYENTFAITQESRPRLFELLEVMRVHPKLKIKIQGHICCMEGDPRDLSTKRAKAVFMFLQQYGVPKSRLSFEGLGTTQPLYPLPENNEEERAANRRVEILVVENE